MEHLEPTTGSRSRTTASALSSYSAPRHWTLAETQALSLMMSLHRSSPRWERTLAEALIIDRGYSFAFLGSLFIMIYVCLAFAQISFQPTSLVVSHNMAHFYTLRMDSSRGKQWCTKVDNDEISSVLRRTASGVELVFTKVLTNAVLGRGTIPRKMVENITPDRVKVDMNAKALGKGTFGIVHPCKLDDKQGYCIKYAIGNSHSDQLDLQKEAGIGSRLKNTVRCVPVIGVTTVQVVQVNKQATTSIRPINACHTVRLQPQAMQTGRMSPPVHVRRFGIVMPRFEHNFIDFVKEQKKIAGQNNGQRQALVVWGCYDLVRAMLELQALGINHCDVKWENVGVDKNKLDSQTPKKYPFQLYGVRLHDLGMSRRGLLAGTFPLRASDWSLNPEDLLCVDESTDESITDRRSDWFQVLMSVCDLMYLVCTPTAQLVSSCGGGAKGGREIGPLHTVGAEWVSAGRQGGWLAWLFAKRNTETPTEVVTFFKECDDIQNLDKQLTMNFKTCV